MVPLLNPGEDLIIRFVYDIVEVSGLKMYQLLLGSSD